MRCEKLSKLLAKHASLEFPSHSDNEELEDWLLDLNEFDGHYIGIAKSFLNGMQIDNVNLADLNHMKARLEMILKYSKIHNEITKQCQAYIRSLEEIISEIKILSA